MRSWIHYINSLIFPLIPETRGFRFKRFLLKLAGVKIGENVRVCSSVRIIGHGMLSIGDNTWIGPQTLIMCSSVTEIGRDVNIAPRCYIGNGTHEIEPETSSIGGKGYSLPISIGDGSWICAGAIILPGAVVGSRSIVASGGVMKAVDKKGLILWGGIPAQEKKTYPLG